MDVEGLNSTDQHRTEGISPEVGKHFNGGSMLMWALQFQTIPRELQLILSMETASPLCGLHSVIVLLFNIISKSPNSSGGERVKPVTSC